MKKFITTEELRTKYGLHPRTMANWRTQRKGPSYIKAGRKILYSTEELENWLKKQTVINKTQKI